MSVRGDERDKTSNIEEGKEGNREKIDCVDRDGQLPVNKETNGEQATRPREVKAG